MPERKRIFVATDLSESDPEREAVRQGDELARALDAELVICHVMPNPLRSNMLFPQLNEQIALDLPEQRDRVVEELTTYVSEVTGRAPEEFAIIVDDGAPSRVIIEKAERYGADLLVIGSHARTALGRILLGDVAAEIVRWAHCPVLISRPSARGGVVVAATDFSEPSVHAVSVAAEEAQRRGARLVLMHAMDLGVTTIMQAGVAFGGVTYTIPAEVKQALRESLRSKLLECLSRVGGAGEVLVTEGTPAPSIARVAEELKAELCVVGTSGAGGLKRITLGSVAEAVARSAPCPVLVVRQPCPA
jgi:nucleotide-binding universal stress UspA family protein